MRTVISKNQHNLSTAFRLFSMGTQQILSYREVLKVHNKERKLLLLYNSKLTPFTNKTMEVPLQVLIQV